jgi:hypothetical protein
VKAVIPTAIRARLRGALVDSPPPVPKAVKKAPPPGPEPMPLEHFLEFTVDDLYYADHDLDRAMDFMAVCRA